MAGRLHDRLAHTFGRDNLFMDVDHIPAGTDFVAHLNSQVAECDVVLVVIGPNWLGVKDESGGRRLDNPDDFVAIEIAAALARNIRVIPVLVDGARMPKASELPDSLKPLARRQAVDVRHAHFGHDAEALVARMREALGDDAAGPRRWRVRAAIGATAVAALLLIGWSGYAFIQHMLTTVEQTVQRREAELKAELERQARGVTEAEAKRAEEAEQQRLAAVRAEEERQAKAAAEAEAKRKAEEAEQQRLAAVRTEEERQAKAAAEAEAKRKAEEAEQQRLAAVRAEEERQAKAAAEAEAKRKNTEAEQRQPAVINSDEARRGAWLGVKIQQVTDQIAESLNITHARGAIVADVVEEGPAKAGGIDVGDVIVKFDGKDIKEVRDIPRIVADTPVGKEVQVTIIRNGAEYTKTVKIGVLPAEQARFSALVNQGYTDTNAGDYDRAIADYNEAIRLDPKSAIAFSDRGVAYMRKGDLDRAFADYNEALRLNPTYGPAFSNRGVAYWKKGDNVRAFADYNEAIRLNPNYAPAFSNRGFAYWTKGDNVRAFADYNEAIRLNPNYAPAFSNRGFAYWTKGDNDQAFADYNEAIRLEPKNAIAFYRRGLAYMRKGDDDRAIADYNEALRLNPTYTPAFCKRGIAKLNINDRSGIADIKKARQLNASACR